MNNLSPVENISNRPFPVSDEYIEFEKTIVKRINAMRGFEENHPRYGERDTSTLYQIVLVNLVGPELADPFLKMFELQKIDGAAVSDASTADALYAKYINDVNLLAATDRMIRLMVKLYDNGESAVEHIEQYGDVQGIDLINAVIAQLESKLAEDRKFVFCELVNAPELPECLMKNISWDVGGIPSHDRTDFYEWVYSHRLEISTSGFWDPDMIAILVPRIRIAFDYWDEGDDSINCVYELESDNGLWFTEGELLFKIHNVAARKNLGDHLWFEGLDLSKNQEDGKSPLYDLCLGS